MIIFVICYSLIRMSVPQQRTSNPPQDWASLITLTPSFSSTSAKIKVEPSHLSLPVHWTLHWTIGWAENQNFPLILCATSVHPRPAGWIRKAGTIAKILTCGLPMAHCIWIAKRFWNYASQRYGTHSTLGENGCSWLGLKLVQWSGPFTARPL